MTMGKRNWVYVDILSGASGVRLKTVKSEIPVFNNSPQGLAIQKPKLIQTAHKGNGLVVAAEATHNNYLRHSTVVISTDTGELLVIGDQLEHPVMADGNGDGFEDLFLLKPRDRSRPLESSQLVSLKGASGGLKFVSGATQMNNRCSSG